MLTENQKNRITLIKNLGMNPKSILDIGAYHGNWAKAVKEIFPDSYVKLIEGNKDNKEELEKTGFPFLIDVLYKEKVDKEYFKCETGCGEGNTIYKENSFFPFGSETVTCNTLDDALDDDPLQYDLVKIDCQGAELDIMKGGVETIKGAKALLLELPILEYNEGAPTLLETLTYIDSVGFRIFDVIDFHNQSKGLLLQIDALFLRKDNPIFQIKQLA
jgi:FkbM family methyltransferase